MRPIGENFEGKNRKLPSDLQTQSLTSTDWHGYMYT